MIRNKEEAKNRGLPRWGRNRYCRMKKIMIAVIALFTGEALRKHESHFFAVYAFGEADRSKKG